MTSFYRFAIFATIGLWCAAPRSHGANESAAETSVLSSFSFSTLSGEPLNWDAKTGVVVIGTRQARPIAMFVHVFQPDCNACREEAKALNSFARVHKDAVVIGVAHRGDRKAVEEFLRESRATYAVAVGTGTDWVNQWGRGDPLYVVGQTGQIVYHQHGYRKEDRRAWQRVVKDLAAGRTPRVDAVKRERLREGDPLPAIELPELLTGKPIRLFVDSRGLVFRDKDGRERLYRASVGFFSRY